MCFAEDSRKATLCITALGIYEAELNGEKVGTFVYTSRDDVVELLKNPYAYAGPYGGEIYHAYVASVVPTEVRRA